MAIELTPATDAAITTKRVSMPDWDPEVEYIEILSFTRNSALESARTAGRKTIVERNRTREEFDDAAYYRAIMSSQVRGWHLLGPDGNEIPFTAENLSLLPWGVLGWLNDEILACNGTLPTRAVRIQTGSGQSLDFKSTDAVVGAPEQPEVSAPV